MKKNRIFAVLTMIALLIACFSACTPNASIADPTEPSEVALPLYEPVFLIESAMSEFTGENAFVYFYKEFKKAKEYGITDTLRYERLEDLENTTIKSPFTGEELKYWYSECYYKNEETKDFGTYYSIYDMYVGGTEQIFLLHGTDLICRYTNSRPTGSLIKVTRENAESLAMAFLTELAGEDAVAGLECTFAQPKHNYAGPYLYSVNFERKLNGYYTDESATVYFDETGVVAFYGYNLCKYKGWEEKIDNRKIERATQALTDKLASLGVEPTKAMIPMITTDVDGKMYLKFFNVPFPDGSAETVFVNVD